MRSRQNAQIRNYDSPALSEHFQRLIAGFSETNARAVAQENLQSIAERQRIEQLLAGFRNSIVSDSKHKEEFADDFNLLEVFRLTHSEIRHSMALEWLLASNPRIGTHGQGKLGFGLFLKEFGLPERYADHDYRVSREVRSEESIVDIEVVCRSQFLIHVENKIWADEGSDQTNREWEDLKRQAVRVGLDPSSKNASVHALFLTPNGAKPTNAHFRAVAWSGIARVMEEFAVRAKPPEVRLFAAHYARLLWRFIATRDSQQETDNGEAIIE